MSTADVTFAKIKFLHCAKHYVIETRKMLGLKGDSLKPNGIYECLWSDCADKKPTRPIQICQIASV